MACPPCQRLRRTFTVLSFIPPEERAPTVMETDPMWPMSIEVALASRSLDAQFEPPRICLFCGLVYCTPRRQPVMVAASPEDG